MAIKFQLRATLRFNRFGAQHWVESWTLTRLVERPLLTSVLMHPSINLG